MADASLGTATLRTKLDTTGLKTGFATAKGETQKFANDSSAAIRGISTAFAAVAASQGVRQYVSFMRSAAAEAHQATAASALFQKALERNGQSAAEGAALVQRLADKFGVVNSVVEESATFMLRQGASLNDVERALMSAGASAAAAGFDISTAFNNVGVAVATGRSQLLETSGIVANLGPVAQAYARSIGKTVEQLTQQELIQARVNAIYTETASEIEDVDILLAGLPRSQAEVTRQWRDFRETAGDLALKVIVPLNDALSATLGLVNDLPEPVKQGGIAMAGAAIAGTALATGITAIKTAMTGLSALGLLSFGPTGWIVLGVAAAAGLAVALSGRGDSLDTAAQKAADAFAKGDADSLTGALDEVVQKFDGEFKDALVRAQAELDETGRVGVENANNIARAFHSAMAQASLTQGAGLFGMFQPVRATLQQAGASMFGANAIRDADKLVEAALKAGDLQQALVTVNDVLLLLKDMPSTARDSLQSFRDQLVQSMNAVAVAEFKPYVPPVRAGGAGTPSGTPADPVSVKVEDGPYAPGLRLPDEAPTPLAEFVPDLLTSPSLAPALEGYAASIGLLAETLPRIVPALQAPNEEVAPLAEFIPEALAEARVIPALEGFAYSIELATQAIPRIVPTLQAPSEVIEPLAEFIPDLLLSPRVAESIAKTLDKIVVEAPRFGGRSPGGAFDISRASGIETRAEADARIAREQAAADQFAQTVVSAGFAMGDAAIKAIQDGDIPGLLRAGLSGAGSILGGANLGTIGFLGGQIGIGSLIAGGLGLIGTLIGALAGGGSRDAEARRQEAARSRSVPAININFTVNQSNTYNGGPRDPANEQAFARQADTMFESIYRRHLGPRLDRLEQRLGIAGA